MLISALCSQISSIISSICCSILCILHNRCYICDGCKFGNGLSALSVMGASWSEISEVAINWQRDWRCQSLFFLSVSLCDPKAFRLEEWNPASKRGQSQTCLNYAEQEQGKADFSRVNLSGKVKLIEKHSVRDANPHFVRWHDEFPYVIPHHECNEWWLESLQWILHFLTIIRDSNPRLRSVAWREKFKITTIKSSFPPRGSAKWANSLCSRSAASAQNSKSLFSRHAPLRSSDGHPPLNPVWTMPSRSN